MVKKELTQCLPLVHFSAICFEKLVCSVSIASSQEMTTRQPKGNNAKFDKE